MTKEKIGTFHMCKSDKNGVVKCNSVPIKNERQVNGLKSVVIKSPKYQSGYYCLEGKACQRV